MAYGKNTWESGDLITATKLNHAEQGIYDATDIADSALEMISPVESSSTASRAYAVGEYFIYNDTLYQATSAIAQGGTITVGTNCEAVMVCGEIGELKDEVNVLNNDILDIQTTTSKNLNKTPYPLTGTLNGVTFTRNADGSITMTGTQSGTTRYPEYDENLKWLLPAGTYTLSGGRSGIVLEMNMYANKSDTSVTIQKSSGTDPATFTTSQNYWAYIRIAITSSAHPNNVTMYPQVEAGTIATAYQNPDYVEYNSDVLDGLSDDVDSLQAAIGGYDTEITALQESVGAITTYEVGKNLVDPTKLTVGAVQSNGSVSTSGSWANYSTSDYIAVEPSTNYHFAVFNNSLTVPVSTARVVTLQLDEDKSPISGTYQNVNEVGHIAVATGITAKYVRVCSSADYKFQFEKGDTYTAYVQYDGKNVIGLPLGDTPLLQSQCGNVLFGKKWAVCGDSFTDGATNTVIADDGKYKGYRYVYPYLIANRNDMEIAKFFNGGQTLAFPTTPGDFTNSLTYPSGERYYQNIPADADYITIYLGINDANHASGSSIDGEETTGEIPIGEITDNTTATYYGAWNVVLTWLITNRPNAHIGIIVTNGNASNDNYRLAQIAIAQKYGVPYIDLNGDARTPAMIRTSNPNIASAVKNALIEKWRVSSDNTHPNDAAHLFESTFIESFLRSI